MRRIPLLLVLAAVVTGCGITRVDAPITFAADRRLEITSPGPEESVDLPVRVTWDVEDFDLSGGNQFGLFVDRVPIGPRRDVRLRVCTEGEKLPPQAGSFRKLCKDDRKSVFLTGETSFRFTCFDPQFDKPKRTRDVHTVSVVLLDRNGRRVGEAVDTIKFRVDEAQVKRCRGL